MAWTEQDEQELQTILSTLGLQNATPKEIEAVLAQMDAPAQPAPAQLGFTTGTPLTERPATWQEGLETAGKSALNTYASVADLLAKGLRAGVKPSTVSDDERQALEAQYGITGLPKEGTSTLSNLLRKGVTQALTKGVIEPIAESRKSGVLKRPREKESAELEAIRRFSEWSAPFGAVSKLDAIMGGGAALGGWLGDQYSENTGTLGETLGGLGPLLASILGKPRPQVSQAVGDMTQDQVVDVLDFYDALIKQGGGSMESAMQNIKTAQKAGEAGTTADLAQSIGLAELESAFAPGTQARQLVKTLGEQRQQQVAEKARQALGGEGGLPEAQALVKEQLRTRPLEKTQQAKAKASQTKAVIEEEAARAIAAEQEKAQRAVKASQMQEAFETGNLEPVMENLNVAREMVQPEVGGLPSVSSKNIAEAQTQARKQLKEEVVDEAYKAAKIEDQGAPSIRDLETYPSIWEEAIVNKLEGRYGENEIKDVIKTYQADLAKAADSSTPRADLISIAQRVKQKARDIEGRAEANILGAAGELLDDALARILPGNSYRKAKEIYTDYVRATGGDTVRKIIKNTPPAEVGEKLFKAGPAGRTLAEDLLGATRGGGTLRGFRNEDLALNIEDYILKKAGKAADTGKLPEFMEQHDEFLTAWHEKRPALKQRLEDLSSQQALAAAETERVAKLSESEQKFRDQTLAEVEKFTEAAKTERDKMLADVTKRFKQQNVSRVRRLKKTNLAKFVKEPKKVVEKALLDELNTTSANDFKALSNAFKTPQEKAAFLGSVADTLADTFKQGDVDKLDKMRGAIEKTLDVKDKALLEDVAQKVLFESMKKSNRKTLKQKASLNTLSGDLGVSLGTVLIMKGFTGNSSLIMAGAVRRALKRLTNKAKDADEIQQFTTAYNDLITRLSTEPQLLTDLIEKSGYASAKGKKPGRTKQLVNKVQRWFENALQQPQTVKAAAIESEGQ